MNYQFAHPPLKTCKLRTAGLASAKSATFGLVRKNANGTPRAHQGVDLASDNNYRCYAVDAGTVTSITRNPSGYGLAITFKIRGQDLWVFYAHLSDVKVSVGDKVIAGQCIGLTGSSGNAAGMTDEAHGSHLHFETRIKEVVGLRFGGSSQPT